MKHINFDHKCCMSRGDYKIQTSKSLNDVTIEVLRLQFTINLYEVFLEKEAPLFPSNFFYIMFEHRSDITKTNKYYNALRLNTSPIIIYLICLISLSQKLYKLKFSTRQLNQSQTALPPWTLL